MASQCQACALIRRLAVVSFYESTPDKKEVPDLDVSALRLWSDVDALVFSASVELIPGDAISIVRTVYDALLVGVASVI